MDEGEIIPSGSDARPSRIPTPLAPTEPAGASVATDQKSNSIDEKAAKATGVPPPDVHETPRKWGEGHASAMFRLGAKELAQALQAFPDSNIRPMEEPGTVGNAPPQVVTKQMGYERQREMYANRAVPERDAEQDKGR